MDKYINRLLEEWIRHKKIIIALDADDTILPYTLGNNEDINRAVELVKVARELGAYIVIYTARHCDNWNEIEEHCTKIEIPIDAINKNCMVLPYGNHGKIYYNIFLDDRAGLTSSLDILDETIKRYNQYLNKQPYTTGNE